MTQLKPIPHGLLQAFRAYESALMSDDLPAVARFFADSPTTLRGDADGLLVGHDAISAFPETRAARGAAPPRTIVQTHVQVIDDDHVLVVAVTEMQGTSRGLQTQLWARDPAQSSAQPGWQITAAHVSDPPPAYDSRVWRLVGDPLVPATDDDGPLSGETVAVKDLYAVQGQRVGAGNPEWLRHATPEPTHAAAVTRLLAAGASIRGIARTDEFAYSLAGTNVHYGTPPNPRAPHRVPGGSSNGSASAVALGHAGIGLGSDTGGSIRVPAAYQGLYGLRTTHGAVDRAGLMPLAPTFDTVGWLTRSAFLLQAVGDILLPEGTAAGSTELVVVPDLVALAQPDVAAAVTAWVPDTAATEKWPVHRLDDWRTAFSTWQAYEAWQSHGEWLATRLDTLGAAVRARFERGRDTDRATALAAKQRVDSARSTIRELVGDRILVLPSASSTAPTPPDAESGRDATLRLTCLAGLGGLPAVSIPIRTDGGRPAGVCLVAAPGRDRDLLGLAVELARL